MKKLTPILAAVFATTALIAGEWFFGTVTVAAGATNATSAIIPVYKNLGGGCSQIDRVVAMVDSGSATGVVTISAVDFGLATTISTSSAISSGTLHADWPKYALVTQTMTGYATTNRAVAYVNAGGSYTDTNGTVVAISATTNYYTLDVPIAVSNSVITYIPYTARAVKASVAQTGVSATATVYNFAVLTK